MAILLSTALSSSVYSMPLANSTSVTGSIEERQNRDWAFRLYQNAQCTGAAAEFSGTGRRGCSTNVPYGSAVALQKIYREPNCHVGFYSDRNCATLIDDIDETDNTACRTPLQGGLIQAWNAIC
ncbi:hypothetical protein BJY04DRAFT_222644 [Aspergillus karnatakaensis]|uniref:uncharacterized protein n=1 Tax=Aspergillus karnatakaensis TaxID=1810916 RepID=UPI003CCC98DB